MQMDGKAARAAGLFPVIMKKSFIPEGEPAAAKSPTRDGTEVPQSPVSAERSPIRQSQNTSPLQPRTTTATQNSGVAGRGGARGGDDGLRNYECFPSSHLPLRRKLHPGRENK